MEEEYLLVDPRSGRPVPAYEAVLRSVREHPPTYRPPCSGADGGDVEAEFQKEQVEIHSDIHSSLAALGRDLAGARTRVGVAAAAVGAALAALGTSPLPVRPSTVPGERYGQILDRYGLTAREHLTCACHVHVGVHSEEEGVGVLDRARVWLPVLLALSTSSPFWQGEDTGYASYRAQALARWPVAGPADVFGSAPAYHRVVGRLLRSSAVLDESMVYFDARLSPRLPTVEIRVPDVCTDVRDAVMVAGLARALVDTEAAAWTEGRPSPEVPTAVLRAATWQAARFGVAGELVNPLGCGTASAGAVVAALLDHVGAALESNGDAGSVADRVEGVLAGGTSAHRQRAVRAGGGSLADVVADAVRLTAGEAG